MTSKNLFFKLMRENTKRRLWTAVLMCLTFFFLFIVHTAMLISTYDGKSSLALPGERITAAESVKEAILANFLQWTGVQNNILVIVFTLAAVICGASGFAWLHSKNKTDFYHSVPVKRECLFFTAYVNGILYTAVPYLISLLLAALVVQIKTGLDVPWGQIILSFGVNMAFYILLYAVVVLAFVMTGNVLVGLLGTGVFFFWGPAILLLKEGYYSVYYRTYNHFYPEAITPRGSPLFLYASAKSSAAGEKALWAIAAAVLVTALSLFLYKRRPSESAGRAMAFKKSEAPIKYLLVIPAALGSALLFHSLKASDGWSVFGLICGLVISYGVIEIIYHFDIRKLFSRKIQLALCGFCAAVILVFFRFDLSGYDSYLPSPDKIESAGVGSSSLQSDVNYAEVKLREYTPMRRQLSYSRLTEEAAAVKMKLTDIAEVRDIAKQGIETTLTRKDQNRRDDSVIVNEEDVPNESIIIQYHMKNGRNVTRTYLVNRNAVESELGVIYNSRELKRTLYPVLDLSEADIAGINYQEMGEPRRVSLPDPSMKGRLLKAYQEELSSLTLEDRKKENIIGAIQFKTNDLQKIIDAVRSDGSSLDSLNRICYYPIYASFKKTAALLKECGIDTGALLKAEDLTKIEVIDEQTYSARFPARKAAGESDGGQSEKNPSKEAMDSLTVTDPVKMQKILDGAVYTSFMYNAFRRPESSIRIRAYAKADGSGDEKLYSLDFDKERIPDFIKEAFQLQ